MVLYNKAMKMDTRQFIKAQITQRGWTLKKVEMELAKRMGRNGSQAAFTQKLSRGSIRFREVIEIADILGCDLAFIGRK